ncbi:MAG: DUF839 domain-containing protein [Woeseiaceae bacterium]|nr:DUF839 domain-containing protein [Woeseiaceae bacterium]
MFKRRQFLKMIAVAAAAPASRAATFKNRANAGFGPLKSDPQQILDLPKGFSYEVISRQGEEMDDGLLVPARHDGMAAFTGRGGETLLVCNHENAARYQHMGPFGAGLERLEKIDRDKLYDYGKGTTPGTGGTTTIVYDTRSRTRKRIHLSLAGTEINCAGGPTPWGSWLSCEEIFRDPGAQFEWGAMAVREQKHGYVFEVTAASDGLAEPLPIRAMGRFEHEAAAVDPATGIVYLSEDKWRSLWYRYLPKVPGQLARGGRLQAMAIKDQPQFDTRNWKNSDRLPVGSVLETSWVDLEDPDVAENDLRFRGRDKGATLFARGEGLCFADGEVFLAATIGGRMHLGQVFSYRPSPAEGTADEQSKPGRLTLVAESGNDSLLQHADNLSMSPWGDLVICEDAPDHCGLVGLTADGRQYPIADNAYTRSELAGICFSPDGSTMFVNIQYRGITLAITGPWSVVRNG